MSDQSAASATAPPPAGPRAIVAGHGDFAAGLVNAVQLITGRGDAFVAVSGRGLSGTDIETLLRSAVSEQGIRVVFTDLQAGSCTMAARKALRGIDDHVLVAGVNLPMLIDFVFADRLAPTEAARHAFERGRDAMSIIGGRP
jgi:PTS system N-acetylgalactosamine-specific IIA component